MYLLKLFYEVDWENYFQRITSEITQSGHYTWNSGNTWKYMEILVHMENYSENKVFEKN